jgi:hypothetical protein
MGSHPSTARASRSRKRAQLAQSFILRERRRLVAEWVSASIRPSNSPIKADHQFSRGMKSSTLTAPLFWRRIAARPPSRLTPKARSNASWSGVLSSMVRPAGMTSSGRFVFVSETASGKLTCIPRQSSGKPGSGSSHHSIHACGNRPST